MAVGYSNNEKLHMVFNIPSTLYFLGLKYHCSR